MRRRVQSKCMDELSEKLKKCRPNVRCNLNGHLINHIIYANDLVQYRHRRQDCLNYCTNVRNLELGMI